MDADILATLKVKIGVYRPRLASDDASVMAVVDDVLVRGYAAVRTDHDVAFEPGGLLASFGPRRAPPSIGPPDQTAALR